jgi:hypothetical protein
MKICVVFFFYLKIEVWAKSFFYIAVKKYGILFGNVI